MIDLVFGLVRAGHVQWFCLRFYVRSLFIVIAWYLDEFVLGMVEGSVFESMSAASLSVSSWYQQVRAGHARWFRLRVHVRSLFIRFALVYGRVLAGHVRWFFRVVYVRSLFIVMLTMAWRFFDLDPIFVLFIVEVLLLCS